MDKIKKIDYLVKLTIAFITAIVSCTITIYITFKGFEETHNELYELNRVATQMSLKSIIWSDNIPYSDIMNACDTYISLGYNSVTKNRCEKILKENENERNFEIYQ